MSRKLIPLNLSDVSTFAKSVRSQLSNQDGLPSHLELLNILAKAARRAGMSAIDVNRLDLPEQQRELNIRDSLKMKA